MRENNLIFGGVMEPTTTGGIFTVKFATVIAGFAGGVVSLSFVTALNWWQRFTAVFTGAAAAHYFTPLILLYFKWPEGHDVNGGVAFVVGITAMNVIPGLVRISELFRANPLRFISFKGVGNGDKGGE